ncbi:MAG TPA: DNA-processing protein DprA [Syntrophorhabdaceae bacterium]|nr:DNA-processing protein DprA [Syntrophorhabdaceae bacterium]
MKDIIELIAISRIKGINPRQKRELVEERQDNDRFKDLLKGFKDFESIETELKTLKDMGVDVITIKDKEYPELLKNIPDPPLVLYKKGRLPPGTNYLSIVGSRKASFEGINISEKMASTLSSLGVTIVSGLARGIDSAAHRGALKGKGKTVAVLGSGIDVCYPPENHWLYKKIGEEGAVISEYGIGEKPLAYHFPERNRIIAGLSKGVIVIEASARSGSLITARLALEYNRDVMAIPGNIFDEEHKGANRLIKEGARLIEGIEDIISVCLPNITLKDKDIIDMDEDESYIYSLIGNERVHIDDIIEQSNRQAKDVLAIITRLEMKEAIRQFPGGFYLRN